MAEITEELITKLAVATAKVIKSYTLYPVNEHLFDIAPSGTSKNLDMDAVEAWRLMILTSIVAVPTTAGGDAIKIGVVSGGTPFWHKIKQSPTADESVVFAGQLILAEGEYIRGRFEYTSAPSQLDLYINGYWIEV
ncbi:hypothetical protein LCGC14_1769500 [marine sediment metagenome]|uniref:Uncharacterized protein n=1 Tax=marine sediment metagenome TaxID=412755 RepID=A0A0F9GYM9_9ZZZZ